MQLLKLVYTFEVFDDSSELAVLTGQRRYILVVNLLHFGYGHDEAFVLVDVQIAKGQTFLKLADMLLLCHDSLLGCVSSITIVAVAH